MSDPIETFQDGEQPEWLALLRKKPQGVELPDFDVRWLQQEPHHKIDESVLFGSRSGFSSRWGWAVAAGVGFLLSFSVWLFVRAPDASLASTFSGQVLFVDGRVFVERDGMRRKLNLGDEVQVQDMLRTTGGSVADIGLGSDAVVRLAGNGQLLIAELKQTEDLGKQIRLFLKRGVLLSHVERLAAGERFAVETADAVTHARGTSFSVSLGSEGTVVSLIAGKVEVRDTQVDRSQVLSEGEMILAGAVWEVRSLEEGAERDFAVLEEHLSNPLEPEIKMSVAPPSFPEIPVPLVEVVRLKDGRVLRGSVSQEGNRLSVRTENGYVTVSTDEVGVTEIGAD